MKNSTRLYCLLGASLFVFSSAAFSQLPVLDARTEPIGAGLGPRTEKQLVIDQNQDRAILHWEDFSIGEDHKVIFNQSVGQTILNRVTSDIPSELKGQLKADGTVWLINPNGMLIGDTARIDTRSFIASTLDVTDTQFRAAPDTINLKGDSAKSIQNRGSITALGGDVILVARHVQNTGQIQASDGLVGLVAGNDVELTLQNARASWLSPIKVKPALGGALGGDGVNHGGVIAAARAELAAAGGNIYGMAVNVSGSITSHGTSEYEPIINLASEGGRIAVSEGAQLRAEAGNISINTSRSRVGETGGEITIAGRLDASVEIESDGWSSIFIAGDRVEVKSTAVLDASGESVGGLIDVRSMSFPLMAELSIEQGAVLRANGVEGQVYLEARDMFVAGDIQALGGGASVTIANANLLDAADARIWTAGLNLENVLSADISNAGNAFESLMFVMWWPEDEANPHLPGDMQVNSGSGTLDVYGYDAVRYKNLTLISQGDLRLDEYAAGIGVSERAVLASLQGKLQIDVPDDGGGLAEARRVRLYSREESELDGLEPDSIIADVVFPDDPDAESRVVLYRIVDAPEPDPIPEPQPDPIPEPQPDPIPEPQPDPVPEPQPDPIPEPQPDPVPELQPEPVPSEPQQAARDAHNRDSAHQQQVVHRMHFIADVDSITGLPTMMLGGSEAKVGVTDDPSGRGLPNGPLYPSQHGSIPGTGENDAWLELLISGATPEVIEALLRNAAAIDEENTDFLEALRGALAGDEQIGPGIDFGDEEARERYRRNMENLLSDLLGEAVAGGLVDDARVRDIIDEAIRTIADQAGYDLDRELPAIDRTAGVDSQAEQRRQEHQQRAEQNRQQQQQEQEQRREQAEQRSRDLLAQMEQRRKEQEEANRRAAEQRQREAEQGYMEQLPERQRQLLEERLNPPGQQQQAQDGQEPPIAPGGNAATLPVASGNGSGTQAGGSDQASQSQGSPSQGSPSQDSPSSAPPSQGTQITGETGVDEIEQRRQARMEQLEQERQQQQQQQQQLEQKNRDLRAQLEQRRQEQGSSAGGTPPQTERESDGGGTERRLPGSAPAGYPNTAPAWQTSPIPAPVQIGGN